MSKILGVRGIAVYAENERPYVPTRRELERMDRAFSMARICRRCGRSEIDGAMFTTIADGDVCDDCL